MLHSSSSDSFSLVLLHVYRDCSCYLYNKCVIMDTPETYGHQLHKWMHSDSQLQINKALLNLR